VLLGDKEQDASHLKYMDDLYTPSIRDRRWRGVPGDADGAALRGLLYELLGCGHAAVQVLPGCSMGPGSCIPFLIAVKKKYDPNNVFHSSMSVRA